MTKGAQREAQTGRGSGRGGENGSGDRGHGGDRPRRARRGAIAEAVLLLLNEKPMHGYDLIDELEKRSQGAWRPSPGAIYPGLRRMESRGLISGLDDNGGKRVYALTADGRRRLADRKPGAPEPWARLAERGEALRPTAMELMSQIREVSRFGSDDQRRQALKILDRTKTELYDLLADD